MMEWRLPTCAAASRQAHQPASYKRLPSVKRVGGLERSSEECAAWRGEGSHPEEKGLAGTSGSLSLPLTQRYRPLAPPLPAGAHSSPGSCRLSNMKHARLFLVTHIQDSGLIVAPHFHPSTLLLRTIPHRLHSRNTTVSSERQDSRASCGAVGMGEAKTTRHEKAEARRRYCKVGGTGTGVWPLPAACVASAVLCALHGVNDSFVRHAASPHLKDRHEGEINCSLRK
ncbi:hypothetical protein E2C01_031075 [Portunus trituberculatus]|uniref:Uncharacterized protein n=1 Tax=Portunus trituberculatus TaxID=210409 RepID=A0A5B7EWN8_PORTR|nr:hypothetical protein [Portunus trituberculatus]